MHNIVMLAMRIYTVLLCTDVDGCVEWIEKRRVRQNESGKNSSAHFSCIYSLRKEFGGGMPEGMSARR